MGSCDSAKGRSRWQWGSHTGENHRLRWGGDRIVLTDFPPEELGWADRKTQGKFRRQEGHMLLGRGEQGRAGENGWEQLRGLQPARSHRAFRGHVSPGQTGLLVPIFTPLSCDVTVSLYRSCVTSCSLNLGSVMGQTSANGTWAKVPIPGLQGPLHVSTFLLGPLPSPLEDMTWQSH